MPSLRVGIDTGGTFTDVVAVDEQRGDLFVTKIPSTPDDPSTALLAAIRTVIQSASQASAGTSAPTPSLIVHGTTTATNAVLEKRNEGLGLIVTQGFRHIIEIARQSVPDGYGNSFFWVKPERIVPLQLVAQVAGRMDHRGAEITPLSENDVLEATDALVRRGVDRIAVCLLHAYANDAHERRVGEILAQRHPSVFVSLSSVVLPEYREYERAMTTLVDVMVKPYSQAYLARAEQRLQEEARAAPFLIMQSNGGAVGAQRAGEKPVTMLRSGPAAGVLGAIHVAQLVGHADILTLDVGGTSTDICLVENAAPRLTNEASLSGYPIKTPMMDLASVGTGGGSLAWIGPLQALKVGPRSAGAVPGPIAYGRGGRDPTVTDAALVLRRLPDALIGGGLPLDRAAALTAFADLGRALELSAEEAAAGVLEIAAANQVNGIRQVTVAKGRDPADYALVAFGGAGGLLATDLADFLGIRTVLSPPNPGNLSAFGLHVADIKRDYVRTFVRRQAEADPDAIETVWQELEAAARAELHEEGVAAPDLMLRRSADARYLGEGHEVPVPVAPGLHGAEAVEQIWTDFHDVHERTFGFAYRGRQDVEVVNLRVQGIGRLSRPTAARIVTKGRAEPATVRPVYWRGKGWEDCPVFRRKDLGADGSLTGPGVIEEFGSTTVLPHAWTLHADPHGILTLERIA